VCFRMGLKSGLHIAKIKVAKRRLKQSFDEAFGLWFVFGFCSLCVGFVLIVMKIRGEF